jgi:hypothetical protein
LLKDFDLLGHILGTSRNQVVHLVGHVIEVIGEQVDATGWSETAEMKVN